MSYLWDFNPLKWRFGTFLVLGICAPVSSQLASFEPQGVWRRHNTCLSLHGGHYIVVSRTPPELQSNSWLWILLLSVMEVGTSVPPFNTYLDIYILEQHFKNCVGSLSSWVAMARMNTSLQVTLVWVQSRKSSRLWRHCMVNKQPNRVHMRWVYLI